MTHVLPFDRRFVTSRRPALTARRVKHQVSGALEVRRATLALTTDASRRQNRRFAVPALPHQCAVQVSATPNLKFERSSDWQLLAILSATANSPGHSCFQLPEPPAGRLGDGRGARPRPRVLPLGSGLSRSPAA